MVEKFRLVLLLHNASNAESATEAGHSYSWLFLPSLAISYFATSPIGIVTGLFLLKMAETFSVDRGFMGQINTFSSIVSVVFALLMGVLSVRFRHKSLLFIGLSFLGASAVGCYLSWDFNSVFLSYSLSGAGIAMVTPMTIALVGENLALRKRASAVGWVLAGGSLAYVIGAPIMGLLAGFGGWRMSLLGFVIPFSVLSLILAFAGIPSQPPNYNLSAGKSSSVESLKEIVSNRSAVGCLLGNVFRNAAFMAILLYGPSFFIERFSLSESIASFVILGGALSFTFGSVVAGSMVNKYGRKFSTVLTALLAGFFTISYAFLPNIWLSLALNFTAAWFMGMLASAASSLTLEQVPRFRGSMMSISSAATSLGSAVGAAVGGMALIWYDYDVLGAILGAMGIVAAMVFYLVTKDPACEST